MPLAAASMTKRERLRATLAGEETDRTPISFWHHFPGRDRTVDGLVDATVAFQRRYDMDAIKLMPTGMYGVLDYGATISLRRDDVGTTQLETTPIASPADWTRLPIASPDRGESEKQVEVVRRLRAVLGPDVAIVETIFSPLTTASKIGGGFFRDHLWTDESSLQQALERFAEDVVAFGRACLEAGADGLFFATQHANRGSGLSTETFERLGAQYDIRVLEALATDERNWFTILHLHGVDSFFDLGNRYPVHAVNWHDRETSPSIKEALSRTKKALVAGMERGGAVTKGDAAAVAAQVRDAIEQSGGRRLVVAPGCVVPAAVAKVETLLAARRAVD